jgi:hypothetical protein
MPSRDLALTASFYERLGFHIDALYDTEGYLIIMRDAVELHFFRSEHSDPTQSDHGAYIRVTDAWELSEEFDALDLPTNGIPRFTKAEDKPWRVCELSVIDIDGNLLRVGHLLAD